MPVTTPEPTLDPSGGSDRVADGHRRIVRSSVPQGRFLVVADWREKLFDGGGFLSDAQVAERVAIKDTGPHHVERIVLVGGESVVVKTYRPKGLLRRLGALLPGAGAMGEWTRGLRCHQAGVACAEPLAAGRLAHASGATVLVTRYLEGARDLAEASREGLLDGPARHLTARALGVFMRTLHDAGFIHHDATAMNFMTTITGDTVRLWAIDLKRMKHLGELTDDHRKRNLTTLFRTMRRIGSWTDYHRFLASYLGDPWADRRKAWARELQVRGTAELTRYLWRWSEPGYMVSRRRVDVSRQGGVLWYARRGQADA
ncbi:MAG: hypothetical protein HRU14_04525, partial [Planctomycetes bacterium]|nr:hypothetical protein [Planctomycetota bacterium]